MFTIVGCPYPLTQVSLLGRSQTGQQHISSVRSTGFEYGFAHLTVDYVVEYLATVILHNTEGC